MQVPPTARLRTSELLLGIANEPGEDQITLGSIVDRFGVRGFGVLILLGTLAAFLPTPVGAGAIAGPVVAAVGLQMVLGLEHPWLPGWLRRRCVSRAAIGRFVARIRRLLTWLEKLSRPRWIALFTRPCNVVSGALIIGHAVVLALPIPLTNYPLALVLVLAAVALIEDDGILLGASWAMMGATIISFVLLSETLWEVLKRALGSF